MFAWFDFWIGIFYDVSKKILYLFSIPMFGIKINFNNKSRELAMIEKKSRKQKVLELLIAAKTGNRTFNVNGEYVSKGWIPAYVIASPEVGGLQGLRRLRELTASGIHIEWQFFTNRLGERTQTTLYRLISDPKTIDIIRCVVITGTILKDQIPATKSLIDGQMDLF